MSDEIKVQPKKEDAITAREGLQRADATHRKSAAKFCIITVISSSFPLILLSLYALLDNSPSPYNRWILDGSLFSTVLGFVVPSIVLYLKDRPLRLKNIDVDVLWAVFGCIVITGTLSYLYLKNPTETSPAFKFLWWFSLFSFGTSVYFVYRSQVLDELRSSPNLDIFENEIEVLDSLGKSIQEARK